MPYQPIVRTDVTDETVTANPRAFDKALVLGQHNFFLERIKFYSSTTEALADLPAYSKEYKAVEAAFSVNKALKSIAIGRRRCASTVLPSTPTLGTVYSFKVVHAGGTEPVTVTATGVDTVSTIGGKIVSAIVAITALSTVLTSANVAGLVTLTQVGSANYKLTEITSTLTAGFVASGEPVTTTMQAIEAVNPRFFAVFSTDRTQVHIEALRNYIATTGYVMSYSTSNSEVYAGEITPTPSGTDFPATFKLAGSPYIINPCYVPADQLDSFLELRVFAIRANAQPGDVIYSNITTTGLPAAKTSDGLLLTKSQISAIHSRGLSCLEYDNDSGLVVFRRGFSQAVGAAAWADEEVIKHFVRARINEAVTTRFFQTNSNKISGRRPGYIQIQNVIQSVGDAMTSTNTLARAFQKGTFKVTIPTDDEIKAAVPYRVGAFKVEAKYEGALDSADPISVVLSY